ncbi:MAG: 4Fe-4S dicluster domain-containing protein [Deltaproteobacteria bacterium]|nr:MAG: 4Fe-4S dicluster domain-containing protein [Deltaproteobacteria bacterium]
MAINRRGFLKVVSAIGASSLVGGQKKALAVEDFSGYPDRYGILTDLTLCIGRNCRKCEAACNKENKLPPPKVPLEDNSVFDSIRRTDAQNYTVVNRFPNPEPGGPPVYVKHQCRHCDEPACASACLVSAFRKTPEGPVVYNKKICIGCRYCMTACPFYVPAYEYDNPFSPGVRKCTMCYESRTSKGRVPACMEACPLQVMTFGKRSELIELARKKITDHPDRYINHIYGEHEVGGTSWLYISGVPFEKLGFPTDLGTKPYPELTRGFLSMISAVLVIGPVLLGGLYMSTRRRGEVDADEETIPEQEEDQP